MRIEQPSSFIDITVQTTPITNWVKRFIPKRMAQTMWAFDPETDFDNEEHQTYWDEFMEDNDLRSILYEQELHLSEEGKSAMVVSFDDEKKPLVHLAQIVMINFERGRKVFSATVVKKINSAGTRPCYIVENHTQNWVKRSFYENEHSMKYSKNAISVEKFNELTGTQAQESYIHNKGWCLVVPFYNLSKMSLSRPQYDLYGTEAFLSELDAIHYRKLDELKNAGTKFYYNGKGTLGNQKQKTAQVNALSKSAVDVSIFDSTGGIGENGTLPIVVQQANYVNTLSPLSQDWDRVMGRFMNSIGDTEPEFESTGVVQQNNLERVQQESSKILSVSSKIKERQTALSYMIKVIGHHTGKLPIDSKEFTVEVKAANVPTAGELAQAMPKHEGTDNTENVDNEKEVE